MNDPELLRQVRRVRQAGADEATRLLELRRRGEPIPRPHPRLCAPYPGDPAELRRLVDAIEVERGLPPSDQVTPPGDTA